MENGAFDLLDTSCAMQVKFENGRWESFVFLINLFFLLIEIKIIINK
jgi:hypothetical protein